MVSLRHKEKFRRALYCLAVGEGDVRSRLRSVYTQLNSLREDEVPIDIRNELAGILDELTKRGPLKESGVMLKNDVENTLDRMKNKSARKIAERVYRLAVEIL